MTRDTRPFRERIIENLAKLRTMQKTYNVTQSIAMAEGWLANGTRYSNEDFDVLQNTVSALWREEQRTEDFKGTLEEAETQEEVDEILDGLS